MGPLAPVYTPCGSSRVQWEPMFLCRQAPSQRQALRPGECRRRVGWRRRGRECARGGELQLPGREGLSTRRVGASRPTPWQLQALRSTAAVAGGDVGGFDGPEPGPGSRCLGNRRNREGCGGDSGGGSRGSGGVFRSAHASSASQRRAFPCICCACGVRCAGRWTKKTKGRGRNANVPSIQVESTPPAPRLCMSIHPWGLLRTSTRPTMISSSSSFAAACLYEHFP